MELTAQKVSEAVFQAAGQTGAGSVHSVFNTSFNLSFGERLVHIGALENGLSPFGIAIQEQQARMLVRLVRQGERVSFDFPGNRILLPRGLAILLQHSERLDLRISVCEMENHLPGTYRERIRVELSKAGMQSGIVQSMAEQHQLLSWILDGTSEEAKASELAIRVFQLQKLAVSMDAAEAEQAFDFWIGRGLGLTPSGDDLLTGLFASLELQGLLSRELAQALLDYLEAYGRKRTTDVAYEYLLYATKGYYHSSIIQLAQALQQPDPVVFEQALSEMEQVGHTSGIDTIIGMLAGLEAGCRLPGC